MEKIGVFTIASKNYLSYVRTLLGSVARVHPEYKLFLCLADRVDGYFDTSREPYAIVEVEKLGIPSFSDFALRYDIMEFNTAVKPFMFRWLFENTDLDAIIYLDPDIHAYSRFDRLETMLNEGASVVLTPHITKPLEDEKSPSDYTMLGVGVFNLGFIAARRCSESMDYMNWWGKHLLTQCVNDLQASLFVDQKWCDLAPCLLDNLKILRDTGYNAAYWNLAQRKITKTENGQWLANGSPLAFFHFSGVNPLDKHLVSKHQNRFTWEDIPAAQPLFEAYNNALMLASWKETRGWPYVFDALYGGEKIHRVVRMLYREEQLQPAEIEIGELKKYLKSLCNQPNSGTPTDHNIRISKLMYLIYRLRGDLQSAFSMDTPEGRKQFASWFEEAGVREYGLPSELTQQHLICENSDEAPAQKKKVRTLAYQTMAALEPLAITFANRLPAGLRTTLKRFWTAVKLWVMRGF